MPLCTGSHFILPIAATEEAIGDGIRLITPSPKFSFSCPARSGFKLVLPVLPIDIALKCARWLQASGDQQSLNDFLERLELNFILSDSA